MLRRKSGAGVAAPPSPAPAGAPREVVEEPTYLGPVLDEAVARTRRRMRPSGVDTDYDLAYEHFDLAHFLMQARQMIESDDIDPLDVFLRNGAEAKASPEANFDMSAYLARHPEHASGPERSPYLEWLKRGRQSGEIADPAPGIESVAPVLGMTPIELVDELASTRSDLAERLRTGTLGQMMERATELEPLIGDVVPLSTRPRIPPLLPVIADQVAAMHACQTQAGWSRARVLLVITGPRWGGGRRIEGHLAHGLLAAVDPHDIVVIYTDSSGPTPAGRFPQGVREVDLAEAVADMEATAAQRVLVELIRGFHAEVVVTINARLMYDALGTYGKALAASERIFLVMFGNEQLALGNWVGVPLRFFYRCFDLVEGVIVDSEHLADWLDERHQLTPDQRARLQVLSAPVDADLPMVADRAAEAGPGRRPQVFWAGRWDRQKRVDLALEVARQLPEVDLRMWGESVLTRQRLGDLPENVRLEGRYAHITDLELADADVWLYTSAWDGVPAQLLEVAMIGIPVVSTLVGGTGEVLSTDDAWLVDEDADADAYVAAIREVLADPARARRQAAALRQRLLSERPPAAYAERAVRLLLPGPGAETAE
jgi:glycosyltransferase involved in cell wall biosynthesis